MSYVNKCPYCSFERGFMGSLVVELVLLFAFSLKSQNKSLSFCSTGNSNVAVCGGSCQLETP